MTVKECYDAMGADYEDVFARLRKDERIQKFLLKVMNDKSYDLPVSYTHLTLPTICSV